MSMMLQNLPETAATCSVLVTAITTLLLGFSRDQKFHEEKLEGPAEFDFIIVGGGTAGCVLANRLTEIENWNVLLLESGREEPSVAEIPAFYNKYTGTDIDWNYVTEPDENSCLLNKGCAFHPGKVLGGTSVVNMMFYDRGHKGDYDSWAEMGNPGWSYKDVLPYFKKSEDNQDQDVLTHNPEYHQTGGYQSISRFAYADPNIKVVDDGFQEIGYKHNYINEVNATGIWPLQATVKNGSRQSVNAAYIRPIREKRSNLVIKTQLCVRKLLIDPSTKKATGVEYISTVTGQIRKVLAKKEVILSSGVFNSPKLLMLSGVGPKDELEKHGINVIQDLSVGENLHDHVTFLGVTCSLGQKLPDACQQKKDLEYYLETQRGPLAGMGISRTTLFLRSKYEENPNTRDLNVFMYSAQGSAYYNVFNFLVFLLNPKSRGYIKLNDTDPVWSPPIINPRFLSEDEDVQRLLDGTRKLLPIFNSTAFKKNGFEQDVTPLPPCDKFEFNTDEYWICVMRQYTFAGTHAVGTCKMGPESDPEAVVSPRLCVHGIKNLRVVDASIMPVIPRAKTSAPVVMIAEKASDMIKEDYM